MSTPERGAPLQELSSGIEPIAASSTAHPTAEVLTTRLLGFFTGSIDEMPHDVNGLSPP
jgi:hypothetical protein